MAPPALSECELMWARLNWQEYWGMIGMASWTDLMISWLQMCCQGKDVASLKVQMSVVGSAPSA